MPASEFVQADVIRVGSLRAFSDRQVSLFPFHSNFTQIAPKIHINSTFVPRIAMNGFGPCKESFEHFLIFGSNLKHTIKHLDWKFQISKTFMEVDRTCNTF
jgi:hypothetical protein